LTAPLLGCRVSQGSGLNGPFERKRGGVLMYLTTSLVVALVCDIATPSNGPQRFALSIKIMLIDGRVKNVRPQPFSKNQPNTQKGNEIMAMKGLQGKVCIITGSARGIGKGIGMRMIDEGCSVVFADLNDQGTEEAAQQARSKGGKAIAVKVDVSDRKSVQAMVERTVQEFGKLDILFNNAGINHQQFFMDTTEENWDRIMKVNALGTLICTQEAAKQMIEQGHGDKIVNTVSLAGRQAYPFIVPYCASKFAQFAVTQASARELAQHKIIVNGFSLGVVDTPLWQQLDQESMEMGMSKEPGEAIADFAAGALAGRVPTPEDIVGLAAFLASSESDYIIGQVVGVDGGMHLF
jgi:meso-butanediol dehydrogenase/(S,S)-butanediol dehydrogenase/diacetyl reductase